METSAMDDKGQLKWTVIQSLVDIIASMVWFRLIGSGLGMLLGASTVYGDDG